MASLRERPVCVPWEKPSMAFSHFLGLLARESGGELGKRW
jgi:hypothetical protein